MMWNGWGSGAWVSWILMSSVMVLFWAGIIALAVWSFTGDRRSSASDSDPRAVLRERFARGEIDAQALASGLETLAQHG